MKKCLLLAWFLLCCGALAFSQAPSVALAPVPAQQFFSQAGVPLASGCVFSYVTGTSTPLATYTDGTGTAQNTNPIILDGGGFGNIWLTNSAYRFSIFSTGGVNCATGTLQRTVDNVSAYTIINQTQNLFLAGAASDPSGSAGELAYRTDIPCFRGFTTLWDCFVTLTGTQSLTNKTLTSPTITTPVINGASTGTGVQGTDSKLLTVGTVTGTGATLCSDANGGATTSGCTSFPSIVFNTGTGALSTTLSLQTMITTGTTPATYRFQAYIDLVNPGTACTGSTTVALNMNFTDVQASGASNRVLPGIETRTSTVTTPYNLAVTSNGVNEAGFMIVPYVFRPKASTVIQYAVTYTPGAACSPGPTYQVFPILEQLTAN